MRILIAEDDEMASMILEMILKQAGHHVVVVSDGLQALLAFRKKPFPVVFSDWQMPSMGGLTLCKEIRKMEGNDKPLIIMITAETGEKKRQEAIGAGVDDFISKPVNVVDFQKWGKATLEKWERRLMSKRALPAAPKPVSTTASQAASSAATPAVARHESNPKPVYPPEARRKRQEGVARLGVKIGSDGRPEEVVIKQTSGFSSLDEAAIQAVRRWIFEPATAAGVPVATYAEVPIRFSLTQG
ncbi:MAG: TonB family protein [Chthoniobacteraceae bacterium]|nr:TonB family protein [Chthoniobacteraceae bacterium]